MDDAQNTIFAAALWCQEKKYILPCQDVQNDARNDIDAIKKTWVDLFLNGCLALFS